MAYYDPNEDPLNPNAPQGNETGPQSGVISGQGSTPSQTNAPSTPAPDKPGNFVGIQQYLEQNKPQSAKLATDVGSYVQGQGESAKNALSEGQGQFDQAVDQSTVKLNDDLFKQAKETPEQVDADQAKKAEFQKMRDAQYKGPSSLETSDYYQPINLAIQNALGTANKTQTASGRSELLADIQKQKGERVSRGAANLDAGLLSASPDSRTILSQARDQITPLQDQMKAVTEAENMKAKEAADQTAKTQAAIQAAFSGPTGVQGQLESNIKSRAQQAVQAAGSDADAIMNLLRTGNKDITDHQLQILGLNRNQYNGLINDQQFYKSINKATLLSDLTSFATKQSPANQITPQSIATPEEYARYQALNDLMGTSNGFLNDPSQAGKANLDPIDFNYAAAPNALADRINNIHVAPQRDGMTPPSFSDLNRFYNIDSNPANSAHLAINIAQGLSQLANNPNNEALRSDVNQFNSMMSETSKALNQINDAYGTKFQLPPEYYNRAVKAVKDNLQAEFNAWPSPYKKMPDAGVIGEAAQISAMITFLNDLQKDVSKVRG
jgi:hypothetical protein